MFGGILVTLLPGGISRSAFAGFVEIDDFCHGDTVAQSVRRVYLNRMKIWTHIQGHWQLIAIVAAVFAMWTWPVIVPLKILVVFLHEASHAFAVLLTGGSVDEMSLSILEGGHVISRGGNLFAIITAGYLGSLVLGAALFVIALQTRADKPVVGLLGVVMVLLAVIYMREFFPLAFCLVTGGVLMAAAWFLDHRINDLILRVIGLTSMIYVPYDIFSDTLLRSNLMSDARIMAENIGGPTVFWGALWLVISVVFVGAVLRFSLRAPSNISFQWRRAGPAPR